MKLGYPSGAARGGEIFAQQLAQFADDVDDARVRDLAQTDTALTISVGGRPGVGRDSVRRALAAAGLEVRPGDRPQTDDVRVYVLAEVLKPEDRAAIAEDSATTVVVLNKADLSGFGAEDSIGIARRRCVRYRDLTGVATVPMVAHLADASLDGQMVETLRALAVESVAPGGRPGPVHPPLLATLDFFGIAQAVMAIRAQPDIDAESLERTLRRHSGVEGVLAAIAEVSARIDYRRIQTLGTALEALMAVAESTLADRIHDFMRSDGTVLARMAAAANVVGMAEKTAGGPDKETDLSRAVRWWRYSCRSTDPVHRACGADIARGSLRRWQRGYPAECEA